MTSQEIFQALLAKRGINDDSFFHPDYDQHTHDPYLLPDMEAAVKRIKQARDNSQTIAIYGDYDIDGLTATAMLLHAFATFGIKSIAFIPDRYIDGYGLSKRGIGYIKDSGAALIVTVDCGSLSFEEIKHANDIGLDVIVTDHHSLGESLPPALGVINPKRKDSEYPFQDLAGVGVAFKLVQALQTQLEGMDKGQEKWLLDLVALGTVCDVVDLVDENRVLVKWGIEVMRRTKRPGFRALAYVSGIDITRADSADFGFRLGPRLNAAGRLETAQASLNLLCERKGNEALKIAERLNQTNRERQAKQREILEAAREHADTFTDEPVLVLSHPDWTHGIVGIVASKLVEEYQKPTFVLQEVKDRHKGSARSFGDFHLADAISANKDLLISGGGHAHAAGVTIDIKKLDNFRAAMNDHYRSLELKNQDRYLSLQPDVELDSFEGLNDELINLMNQLQPFGNGNRQPIFLLKDVQIETWRPVGADKRHAKLTLKDKNGKKLDSIGFGLAGKISKAKGTLKPLGALEHNEFNGRTDIQLRIIDV